MLIVDKSRISTIFGHVLSCDSIDLASIKHAIETHFIDVPMSKVFAIIRIQGQRFFCKCERSKKTLFLRRSIARRACAVYETMINLNQGFLCPEHYGWWEVRRFGFLREWGLVTKYVADAIPLHDILMSAPHKLTNDIAESIGAQIGLLHANGYVYNAVDENNIIVRPKKNAVEVWFIDLEHTRPASARLVSRDLMGAIIQLLKCCPVNSSEILSFYTQYAKANPRGANILKTKIDTAASNFQGKWGCKPGSLREMTSTLVKKDAPRLHIAEIECKENL